MVLAFVDVSEESVEVFDADIMSNFAFFTKEKNPHTLVCWADISLKDHLDRDTSTLTLSKNQKHYPWVKLAEFLVILQVKRHVLW